MNTRTTTDRPDAETRLTRALLLCGAVGAPLFLVVILIEGALRPGYDPLRDMSSALSLTGRGWVQIGNFVLTGLAMIAYAVGLRRVLRSGRGALSGPVLIGVWGAGLIGAGVFVGDPADGYPEGTPPGPAIETTLHGALHNAVSMVVFLALAAACLVFARRSATVTKERGWAVYSALTALALPALQPILHAVTPDDVPVTGMIQKITIAVGWGWAALMASKLRRDLAVAADAKPVETR